MAAMLASRGQDLGRRRNRGSDEDRLLAAMCALEERQMKAAGADLAGQRMYLVAGKQFQVVDFGMPALRADDPKG